MTNDANDTSYSARARRRAVEEIGTKANSIRVLAPKSTSQEIGNRQGALDFEVEERDVGGIGMGILSDGTPYLNQRGLAALCGVQNAHIGTISSQWSDREQKPRITAIKKILEESGYSSPVAHLEIAHNGRLYFCYPAEICLAVLEYYAFEAGMNCQPEARTNFRQLAGSKLREMIYRQLGYDPNARAADRFKKWHDRIALNFQSAPRGFFHVFNEANTIIYELILAGADVGEKFVVDISIGQHWSKHWETAFLSRIYGDRRRYPHRYPDTHPQAKSNPQDSWCYPTSALGAYREWLQDEYLEGGKFRGYLTRKVGRGEITSSAAQLAIRTLAPQQIAGPRG